MQRLQRELASAVPDWLSVLPLHGNMVTVNNGQFLTVDEGNYRLE